MHDAVDQEAAKLLAKYLESKNVEVMLPLFGDDPSEIRRDRMETLQTCDAAVILWGSATEAWLRTIIRDLRRVSRRRKSMPYAIYIAPPFDHIKRDLSIQGPLVIRAGSFTDLDPLIAQLDRPVA